MPAGGTLFPRGFRGPALGRNNFYGSHSKRGTEVAAKAALAAALAREPVLLPHAFNPD